MNSNEIRKKLFEMQDLEYRDFQCKLMPGVDVNRVIGVRTPLLRALAKEIFKSGNYEAFLSEMPHEYYDEMNLHGFILCELKDYDTVLSYLDAFLPYVDNWATCDLVSPKKAFKKNLSRLETDIRRWMNSGETYTIRFGIEMLMSFFLEDHFDPKYLDWVAGVHSQEYYINMMRAWYFATALAKQWDATADYLKNNSLDDWTMKKTFQKSRESRRVDRAMLDQLVKECR